MMIYPSLSNKYSTFQPSKGAGSFNNKVAISLTTLLHLAVGGALFIPTAGLAQSAAEDKNRPPQQSTLQPTQAPAISAPSAPARDSLAATFAGKELFVIYSGRSDQLASQRAKTLSSQLDKVISDQHFEPAQLRIRFFPDHNAIVYGDATLVTVSQTDASSESVAMEALAERRLATIRAVIDSERAKRNFNDAIDQVRFGTVKSNLLYLLGNPLSLRIGISILGLFILIVVTYSIRRSIPIYFHESYKRYTVSKIAEFSSYFLGLVFLSVVFSDTLGSLAVIIGAATAGIALALKELIVSMAGWLAITFGDTYRVGDRVQIAGIKGDVIDVGLLRTTLMELGEWVNGDLYTGRIVRVANGSIFAGPTFNYTRDLSFLWDEVVVSVTNDSDAEAMRSIIQKIVDEVVGDYVLEAKLGWERLKEKYLVEDEKIEPLVTFAILDKSVAFTARYPVDFRQRRIVKDEVFTAIMKEIRQSEGRIRLLTKE